MPRIIKKVQMIDPETSQTWHSSRVPGSGGSSRLNDGHNSNKSSGNISISSQDAVIEQLRLQHKKIVAEGRQRIIGNLTKHSMREINQNQRYPFSNGSVLNGELQER